MSQLLHPTGADLPALLLVAAGWASALLLSLDLLRRPQRMGVMNLVWPITGLYAGPLALWAYWTFSRASDGRHQGERPLWQAALIGACHCGAGCTLGDVAGEALIGATGWQAFGSILAMRLLVTFTLAYAAGLAFQYFAIAPMRGLNVRDGLIAAAKADTLSLLAYQAGMFAAMAGLQALFGRPLASDHWIFWAMMQGAMLVGLAATAPVNAWLIATGVKERM